MTERRDDAFADGHPPRRASPILLGVLVVAALGVLLSLGTWQVLRLGEKEALIARVAERINAAPEALPARADWPALQADQIEFRRVAFEGTFRHDDEVHVFITLGSPKGPIGGQGYFVVTPADLADGTVVFVNRGFVPLAAKDPATRAGGQLEGPQPIVGLIRPPEPGTWVTPAADVARNVWFSRDPAAMAAARDIPADRVAPFTVDQERIDLPGGLPQGGETLVSFPNSHLQYAVTWYGLAAALVAVYASFLFNGRRRRG